LLSLIERCECGKFGATERRLCGARLIWRIADWRATAECGAAAPCKEHSSDPGTGAADQIFPILRNEAKPVTD
jgi:hypothetical protein